MVLKIVGTGSKGNCYILENKDESLLIECGVNFNDIKKALNFNLRKVAGALITHEHSDHSKSINEVMKSGINVYAIPRVFEKTVKSVSNHRQKNITPLKKFKVGNFKIMAFEVVHDVPCVGFQIFHPDSGNIVFLTDTAYCPYIFNDINHFIIEANYCPEIAKQKLNQREFLRDRILQSHMSIDTCEEHLKLNNLRKVRNIVLIHLSDLNSNEREFQQRISRLGKKVTVANNGIEVDFNKDPF
jgi:phosphoribosyl 1,2-cyclic phosphodiesterase